MKKTETFAKKIMLFMTLIPLSMFSITSCASSAAKQPQLPPPDWLSNYRAVYPNAQYIAQRGSGPTSENAKTDAIAQLSRYIKTSVTSNLSSSVKTMTIGTNVDETITDIDETAVSSNADLFALESTIPYRNTADGNWYCVAYINREEAWSRYVAQVESSKTAFYSFYDKATAEKELLSSIVYYKKAWESGKEFLEKLEFARIISDTKENAYKTDRDNIAKVPAAVQKAILDSGMALAVTGDYGNFVTSAVNKVFSDLGFHVGGKGNQYTIEVVVSDNEIVENKGTEAEIYQIAPDVKVAIVNRDGKEVYSYRYKSTKPVTVGSLETGHKREYPKLAEKINTDIPSDFAKKFGL